MKITIYHPILNKTNPLADNDYVYKQVGEIEVEEYSFRHLQNDFSDDYYKLGIRSCMGGDIIKIDDKFIMFEGLGQREVECGKHFKLAAEKLFEHDCDNCTFLGQSTDDSFVDGVEPVDLYVCLREDGAVKTVISRFGSFGGDYSSGLQIAKMHYNEGRKTGLAEAYRRCKNIELL